MSEATRAENVAPKPYDLEAHYQELEQKITAAGIPADLGRVRAAFECADRAHSGQKRRDGSPYVSHCIAAAIITAEMGLDEDSIIAALLHDCTKKLDMDEQLALCRHYGIPLDELEQKALKLLHSKTGAAIARDVFAVDDDVYSAILYHTTGKPDMTLLEKIIYLADYIEPTRDFPGVEALRRTVYEDLDRGLLMGLTMTIDEMEEMGNPVHHMTRDARDYLMKRGIS